jgi:hypothetical protein
MEVRIADIPLCLSCTVNTVFAIDIEDMLKTLTFLYGKKWTSMMVSRVYFGNWLRDYSQAVDVGSLKGVNAATIRIIVSLTTYS